MPIPAALKTQASAEAIKWVQDVSKIVLENKEIERAAILAADEYDASEYVARIVIADKARELLRAVNRAVRDGVIPKVFDRSEDGMKGQLITTGLKNHDPRVAFQTALRAAYAAGREQRFDEDEDTTYVLYRSMQDGRVRPTHAKLNGMVLPKNDPAWKMFSPPLDWRCRCQAIPLDDAGLSKLKSRGVKLQEGVPDLPEVEHVNRQTGEKKRLPEGVAPGFDNRKSSAEGKAALAKLLADKMAALKNASFDDF